MSTTNPIISDDVKREEKGESVVVFDVPTGCRTWSASATLAAEILEKRIRFPSSSPLEFQKLMTGGRHLRLEARATELRRMRHVWAASNFLGKYVPEPEKHIDAGDGGYP